MFHDSNNVTTVDLPLDKKYGHKSFTMVTKFTKFAKVFQCVILPIDGIAGLCLH